MSFKEDVSIDRHSLDYEWLRQADLFHKYSEDYANAMFERDKKKERLTLVKAQIDGDIRLDPESYGFTGKPTEPAIASLIIQDERYEVANSVYLEAVRDMNVVAGAKIAMEHKKTALEVLAKLYLSGYWGEARIPDEARKKYETENESTALNSSSRLQSRLKSKRGNTDG